MATFKKILTLHGSASAVLTVSGLLAKGCFLNLLLYPKITETESVVVIGIELWLRRQRIQTYQPLTYSYIGIDTAWELRLYILLMKLLPS